MRAPGKKVGKLSVKLERKTSRYDYASIEVELRLDVHDGTFHAEYEGTWYDARTKDELNAKIRQAAQKTIDVEWTRYLVVDYEAKAWPLDGDSGRPETSGHYETLSIDEDRATLARDPQADKWSNRNRTRVVTSIDLHWHVCEFSTPYALPEDKKKTVRMRREVDCQLDDRDDNGPLREVVYILEREGPRGGAFWLLVLECGHAVSRPRHEAKSLSAFTQSMFRPLAEKLAPKRVQCHYCGAGCEKHDPWKLIKALGGEVP